MVGCNFNLDFSFCFSICASLVPYLLEKIRDLRLLNAFGFHFYVKRFCVLFKFETKDSISIFFFESNMRKPYVSRFQRNRLRVLLKIKCLAMQEILIQNL
jgi:hypothetical protein